MLAVAAAYVITQLVTENVVERYNKQLFEAGKISSELLVGYETQLLETLRLLSNVEGVPRAILAKDPGKRPQSVTAIMNQMALASRAQEKAWRKSRRKKRRKARKTAN